MGSVYGFPHFFHKCSILIICLYLSSKLLITTIIFLTTSVSTVCLYQDSAGEPLYKLFRAIKHQIEKGPVDARVKKAKYTLNDTGLLGDDVEYSVLVRWTETHTHNQAYSAVRKTAHTGLRLHGILCLVSNTNTHK